MIVLCVLGVLYFLPTIIASNRGHEAAGVLLLNLFFGWTGIGWIALLLWALLSYPPYRIYPAPAVYYYPPDHWRR
jgi:Superinfection immunity protein